MNEGQNMGYPLFNESAAPLYRQVADHLIHRIQSGQLAPGAALPPEDKLCQEFGVSRVTVRKAVEELLQRHLVVRRRGVGTFVSDPHRHTKAVTLIGVIDEVLPRNQVVVLDESLVSLPAKLRETFGLGAQKWKCVRAVNHVAPNEPLDYAHFYFSELVADGIGAAEVAGPLPPVKYLQTHLNVRIDHADQLVEPIAATPEMAKRLGIAKGTPALRAIRIYYDDRARPVEIVDAVYHPERYRYTATLYPKGPAGG